MLWVILQKFWQKTNLKLLILLVYNEVKIKYIHDQVYSYGFNDKKPPAFKTNRSSGAATISVKPNPRSTGAAGINPALTLPDTSERPITVGEEDITGT